MDKDRILKDLKAGIYNRSLDKNMSQEAVFNTLSLALEKDCEVYLSLRENSQSFLEEDKFESYLTDENGKFLLGFFTDQQEAGKASYIKINLKSLLKKAKDMPACKGLLINPYSSNFIIERAKIDDLFSEKSGGHILLYRGSLLDLRVDAIVNAANSSLLGGGGIDGAIHRAAGPELLQACKKLKGCPTGEAKITAAYNIGGVDYIIHTVGPIYGARAEDKLYLSNCYRNSLDIAKEKSCLSIAFPCISTGVYGYPLNEACKIALETIKSRLKTNASYPVNIYLACFRKEEFDAFRSILK